MSKLTFNNVLPKFIKTKSYHYYHAFTDNTDWYFDIKVLGKIEALEQAMKKVKEWESEGETNTRVYMVEEFEDFRDGNIELETENCIYSFGKYPL